MTQHTTALGFPSRRLYMSEAGTEGRDVTIVTLRRYSSSLHAHFPCDTYLQISIEILSSINLNELNICVISVWLIERLIFISVKCPTQMSLWM